MPVTSIDVQTTTYTLEVGSPVNTTLDIQAPANLSLTLGGVGVQGPQGPAGPNDHTLLTNIGTNTHAQIDTHVADGTLHFTKDSISIENLSDVASMTPVDGQILTFDNVNGWQAEDAPAGVTDHTLLTNIGTNTHAQIDTHLADATLHFTMGSISITESQVSNLGTTVVLDSDIGSTVQGYDANTTIAGNTFNGVNQLVQLDGTGALPALDGSNLTGVSTVTGYTPIANGVITSGDQVILNTDGTVEELVGTSEAVTNLGTIYEIDGSIDNDVGCQKLAYDTSRDITRVISNYPSNNPTMTIPSIEQDSFTLGGYTNLLSADDDDDHAMYYDSTANVTRTVVSDGFTTAVYAGVYSSATSADGTNGWSGGSGIVAGAHMQFAGHCPTTNQSIVILNDGGSPYETYIYVSTGVHANGSHTFTPANKVKVGTGNISFRGAKITSTGKLLVQGYPQELYLYTIGTGTVTLDSTTTLTSGVEADTKFIEDGSGNLYMVGRDQTSGNIAAIASLDISGTPSGTSMATFKAGSQIQTYKAFWDSGLGRIVIFHSGTGYTDLECTLYNVGTETATTKVVTTNNDYTFGSSYSDYVKRIDDYVLLLSDLTNSDLDIVVYDARDAIITTNAQKFIGYSNGSAIATENVSTTIKGDVVSGLTGLTQGTSYYLDYDGSLVTSATDYTTNPIGVALSATELLLKGAGNDITL